MLESVPCSNPGQRGTFCAYAIYQVWQKQGIKLTPKWQNYHSREKRGEHDRSTSITTVMETAQPQKQNSQTPHPRNTWFWLLKHHQTEEEQTALQTWAITASTCKPSNRRKVHLPHGRTPAYSWLDKANLDLFYYFFLNNLPRLEWEINRRHNNFAFFFFIQIQTKHEKKPPYFNKKIPQVQEKCFESQVLNI